MGDQDTAPRVYNQEEMEAAIISTRSFYGPALITLVLYWMFVLIGGFIANLIYLNSAYNTKKVSGKSPEGLGCLWALLVFHSFVAAFFLFCFFLPMVQSIF